MLKTKVKFMIIVLGFVIALCLFNTNTVNAATPKVTTQSSIIDTINISEQNNNYKITANVDSFNMYDISKNTNFNQVTSDGYVYDVIYIEIPSNIDEINLKDTNTNLEIVNNDGINYFKYNMKLFKKNIANDEDRYYDETINVEYKENNIIQEEKTFSFSSYYTGGYCGPFDIVDSNNNVYMNNGGSSGDGGSVIVSPVLTENDYTNDLYRFLITENIGESFNVDKLGTFYYDGTSNEYGLLYYVYKAKITDFSIFESAGPKEYFFELVNPNTNKGSYCQVVIDVKGYGRKTYKLNNENISTGISLNGSVEIGASLVAEQIQQNSTIYVDMVNSISSTIDKKLIFIDAFDLKIINGEYEGELLITFDLGTENNGKKVRVWHKKADNTIEEFNEIVTNGKITIKVTELSPFLLAYEEQETIQNVTNETLQGEKDNTPKTGTDNTIINNLSLIAILGTAVIITKRFIK